ncbi:preprotein translocase subunit SecG [Butyricicoccus pullicaecorum]|uniref:Protein-export membrane protein SecG n=2 Tax=Butyricicoccus pullicaecorum TaxID=501571 RepID=R8W135_9FIRM|nr:preprotein translocase subunit SecG [Butyricicoccus pullicaecorum]EOQ38543.1 preprotein translocase, SecG subunit [Butyricicoccus pullicaecorum 1.2]MBS5280344.1 preprotein translocase subunit SecG [Butyricicoccus pullicaecorum]MDY2969775.1 preprotein translocase subunit SecG [Butyricicoccus pullicaecorum]OUP51726.1 preprotein translocase subunit SecG [Butyricicoccus pullicaecorum]OUP58095.1 preprotein translocase subunit SecG [Butyricicoccus pullicaecorum]
MGTLKLVLSIVEVIACVFLTVVVLLQQGARQGLSGSIAGGADTFFGQSKASNMQRTLSRLTTAIGVIFVVIAVVMNCI